MVIMSDSGPEDIGSIPVSPTKPTWQGEGVMIQHVPDRNYEWPITRFWYTKKAGQTIEHIIDTDISWFEWAVSNFQNVTPSQAQHYEKVSGRKMNPRYIQDVTPYEYKKGDPEQMYMELCECQDLDKMILKHRGVQLELF